MNSIISLSLYPTRQSSENKYNLNMSILEGNKVINKRPMKPQTLDVFKEHIKEKYNPDNLEEKFSEIKRREIILSTIQHFIDKGKDFIFIFDVFSQEDGFEEILLCKMRNNEFIFEQLSLNEVNSNIAVEVGKLLQFSESNCVVLDGSFRLNGEDYIYSYKQWEEYINEVKSTLNETRDIREVEKIVTKLSESF